MPVKYNAPAPVLMMPSPAPPSVTFCSTEVLVGLMVARLVSVTLLNIGTSELLPVSVSVWPPIVRLLKATMLPVPVPLLRFTVTVALPFTTTLLVLNVKVLALLLVATSSTCTARVPPRRVTVLLLPRPLKTTLPPPLVAVALACKVPPCTMMPPVKVLLAGRAVVMVNAAAAPTVAAAERVIVVELVMPAMVAPAGMPVPVMYCPTCMPAVDTTGSVVLAVVAVPLVAAMLGMPRLRVLEAPALTRVPAPLTTPPSVTPIVPEVATVFIRKTAFPAGPRLVAPLNCTVVVVAAVLTKLRIWPWSPGDPPKVRLPLVAPTLPALGTPSVIPACPLLPMFNKAVPWFRTMLLG